MKRLPLAIALCALLATGSASACSCEGEIAGFIHADLKRLPANARGALFQLPPGPDVGLDAAAFTTMRGGRDLIHANCQQPGPPVTVRGHAGLLEVEDGLQTTNDLPVDFRYAAGQACSGGGMLDEAFAQADTARIRELVCAVGDEPWYLDDAPQPSLPSLTTLVKLARMPDGPPKACMASASSRWQNEMQYKLRRMFRPLSGAVDPLRYGVVRIIEKPGAGLGRH